MKNKIGITGSHGFIGEHLVAHLGEENVLRLGREPFVPDDNLSGIIDLAAFGNLPEHKQDYLKIYDSNFTRVLGLLNNSTPDFFIYISTSSVGLPYQTYYSGSKKATEDFLKVFAREMDFPVAIVRPFSITGVGEQSEHLIPKLINSCLTGQQMPFVANPVHDFVDVQDLVNAIQLIVDNIQKSRGDIYDVGTGIAYSNEQVKAIVELACGSRANLKQVDNMRKYDNKSWVANPFAISALGWTPSKTLEQSITEMVKHAKKNT